MAFGEPIDISKGYKQMRGCRFRILKRLHREAMSGGAFAISASKQKGPNAASPKQYPVLGSCELLLRKNLS